MIQTVGILSKPHREAVCKVLPELHRWLTTRHIRVLVEKETATCGGLPDAGVPADELRKNIDLAIVLGGDGTLLSAARLLGEREVLILGVNLGGLGFLTSVPRDELYPQLEIILEGKHQTSARMMLEASVIRDGQVLHSQRALNDAVVNQAALARLMDFDVYVDSSCIGRYRADGLIIATPTGSTAYSLAAGGPIVHPSLEAFVITPICPHMLTNRPIVIPDTAHVEIDFIPGAEPVHLTLDGQVGFGLARGDRVVIRKSANRVLLISSRDRTYYGVLRNKLRWGEQ
jgi:NAD+ kinase